MFDSYPTYSRYRTLRLTDPVMRGEDVFALQTALSGCGFDPGVADGILGQRTSSAIVAAQKNLGLVIDGLAGGKTQETLGRFLGNRAHRKHGIADGLMRGQLEHESSWRLGNYSPQRADGSYDAGVAQRNTAHTIPRDGFDAPLSINALALNTRTHYDLFAGVEARRRWTLAAGAWNAPAFACWIANEEGASVPISRTKRPSDTSRALLEAYMRSVTAYLSVR